LPFPLACHQLACAMTRAHCLAALGKRFRALPHRCYQHAHLQTLGEGEEVSGPAELTQPRLAPVKMEHRSGGL